MPPCSYWFSLSSAIISPSHLRSCCLSFLFLAVLLTCVNLLTTTTSIAKLTINEYTTELKPTTTTTSSALLLFNFDDVYSNALNCYEQVRYRRLRRERNHPVATRPIKLHQPNQTSTGPKTIPYDYDAWQSAPVMPRLVTTCEHHLMMQLLKRFDQLTRKYSLEYMIIDGTLLGSWRHHDLIPWDDDIDLMMSIEYKHRLNMAIELESPASPYYIEFYRRWDAPKAFEYYKFYFSTSPRFSEHPWRYPFVDLIFYHENETHVWQENMQHVSVIPKQTIFPLKLRPFGSLWLPSPRDPRDYFLNVNWTRHDHECVNGPWSHKYERTKDFNYPDEWKSTIDCTELKQFYPFVERSADDQEERLLINGTVQHIVRLTTNK